MLLKDNMILNCTVLSAYKTIQCKMLLSFNGISILYLSGPFQEHKMNGWIYVWALSRHLDKVKE